MSVELDVVADVGLEPGESLDHYICCQSTPGSPDPEPTMCGIEGEASPGGVDPNKMCVVCLHLADTLLCPRTQGRCPTAYHR